MKNTQKTGARIVGAVLFAAAAAAASYGALWGGGEGAPDLRAVRETAPLAAVVGALLGYPTPRDWPKGIGAGLLGGALTAVVGLILFVAVYLFGDAVIEAARGGDAGDAVADATARIAARLPLGAPMAIAAFAAAGALHWLIGSVVSRIAARRGGRASGRSA